jgi:hypothetical protein
MRFAPMGCLAALSAVAICGRAGATTPPQQPTSILAPVHPIPVANLQVGPSQPNNLGTFGIVIVPGPGLASNAPALAAFNRAAQAWSGQFSDPITVTINADLRSTDPGGNPFPAGVIGSTSSVTLQGGYDLIRNQMVADAQAQPPSANNQIVSSLPTSGQFSANLPAGRSFGGNILVTKANAKALGFTGLDGTFGVSDANMVFNSGFTFDFDSSNGVTPGQIDFQTTATHEIGHALGFTSIVDSVNNNPTLTSVSPTTLDLFRFGQSSGNPQNPSDFTTFARELRPGQDSITDDLTSEYRMSSGLQTAEFPAGSGTDGQQASHWKDDVQSGVFVGIMDPTLAFGTIETPTDADYRAFDLIGYDVVPEPSALAGFVGGLLLFAGRRAARRRERIP